MTEDAQDKGPGFGDLPLRFVARVTIEFTTPFVVSTGRSSTRSAADFVRDVNGLPAIPGTSLCGVLRHAMVDYYPNKDCNPNKKENADLASPRIDCLFGPSTDVAGSASRLSVSWAHIHNAKNVPVDGLLDPASHAHQDAVLANARIGTIRNRVRISHQGASDGRGKFEDLVVSRGHRFTFDLTLRGTEEDEAMWTRLLALLNAPQLRLGKGTRHGHGAFEVTRCLARCFDLSDADDFTAYCCLPAALDHPVSMPERTVQSAETSVLTVILRGLRPKTPWLFGGGAPEANEDIAPVTETVICWDNDRGHVSDRPTHVLAASGIKGALSHRLAWHYNRLTGVRADTLSEQDFKTYTGEENLAVQTLLGKIPKTANQAGRRGWLLLDDLFLEAPAPSQEVNHVSLDRFSGGARSSLLFSERVLNPADIRFDYRIILVPPPDEQPQEPNIREALRATLYDVRRGRIAFGSGTGRGNGWFLCDDVDWSDGGAWIDGQEPSKAAEAA